MWLAKAANVPPLRQRVIHQKVRRVRLNCAVKLRHSEQSIKAVHVGALRPVDLDDVVADAQPEPLRKYIGHRQGDFVASCRLLRIDRHDDRLHVAQQAPNFPHELIRHEVACQFQCGHLIAGLGGGVLRVLCGVGQLGADGNGRH